MDLGKGLVGGKGREGEGGNGDGETDDVETDDVTLSQSDIVSGRGIP